VPPQNSFTSADRVLGAPNDTVVLGWACNIEGLKKSLLPENTRNGNTLAQFLRTPPIGRNTDLAWFSFESNIGGGSRPPLKIDDILAYFKDPAKPSGIAHEDLNSPWFYSSIPELSTGIFLIGR